MILIDIKMPSRCADCPCFNITRSDGEIYGDNGCQLMHLIFNEDVYYGKHIHNPFESRYEDCPLRNASDFLKTIADRPKGKWVWNNDSGDYFCSVCGKVHYYNIDEIISGAWKFCPSCGAYMKGGEDK